MKKKELIKNGHKTMLISDQRGREMGEKTGRGTIIEEKKLL